MPIFQKSIVDKYLDTLETDVIEKAYDSYKEVYSAEKIKRIKTLNEEKYQAGFLKDIFGSVLGYTIDPEVGYNIELEKKNETNSKKADGAIVQDEKVLGVIELKSNTTKNLESIKDQAFGYKNNHKGCKYVISSNFHKLRFYVDDATEYEEFDLYNLDKETFKKFYLYLRKEGLLDKNIPKLLKEETKFHEENISKQLYKDYSAFKNKYFENIVKNNPQYDKLLLFKKSQKFLDRILFVLFAEDKELIPTNAISRIVESWALADDLHYKPLYELFTILFEHLNVGHTYKSGYEIPAYNGGLFAPDEVLDNLKVDDEILKDDLLTLSKYDFNTDVDVNILGHIFEHSLSEIEEIEAELKGEVADKSKGKRKKDGVFYTPKYITKYMVDNTVGELCAEKKEELGLDIDFDVQDYQKSNGSINAKGKELFTTLESYKEWLLQLKILDPACGSGAFLNQALSFLIEEHKFIDDIIAELTNTPLRIFDTDKAILENNIYGVDINEESVEIAKLSLWLRTAQKGRKLSNLNSNIKCGNSLIDDPEIAGDNAFNWVDEFPEIFAKGGFDVVIGNPPYGDYFSESEKSFLLKRYKKSFSGTFDMYIVFFEIALHILKTKGLLCFITPNTFIDYSQFGGLRDLLTTDNDIKQVLGLTKVFEDAIVDTAIILISKNKVQSSFFRGKIFKNKLIDIGLSDIPELKAENLDTTGFTLKDSGNFDVRSFTDRFPNKLSDVIKITQGITTGGNECFLNNSSYFLDNGISEKVFHKVLKGKTINRYRILFDDDYILYSTKKTDMGQQSVIENLLTPFKEKLSKKRETKQGKLPWYCLHWARNEKDFNEPKILIRQTATHILGVLDTNNYYPIDSIHTLNLKKESTEKEQELKFLLGILNSKLFKYLYSWKLDEAGTVYPQVKKVNIEWFPMVKYDNSEKLSITLDSLLSIWEKESVIRIKFLKYLDTQFEGVYKYTGIQNWYELEFGDFIKELNKAIKKAGGEKLTKSVEMDWMDIFETKKEEAQALKSEIDKTDKEIDHMVYELYGLSEEEIKIVENS